MANITISIKDDLLKAGREYAKTHNTSLNAILRELLEKKIPRSSGGWVEECFNLMDKAQANSKGNKWTRDDLYDV